MITEHIAQIHSRKFGSFANCILCPVGYIIEVPKGNKPTRKEKEKMLDYEVYYYNVQWWEDDVYLSELHFDTEENAVEFIKANRDKWSDYRLLKIQKAVIDF